MSIVIVGGNDRMATRYQDICKSFHIKSKVFTQMPADLMMNWVRPTMLCAKKEEISDRYTQCEAYSCNSL
jgi:hypothetical protein